MSYEIPKYIYTPDRKLSPPDVADVERKLTPSEIVGAFMSGENPNELKLTNKPDEWAANDFSELIDLIRFYKRDPNLTDEDNLREKMAQINEYLDEVLLEYVAV